MEQASFATFPEVSSWKRDVMAFVASFVNGFGVAVLTDAVVGVLAAGAVALTGMAWVGLAIAIIGWLIGFVAAVYSSGAVARYIYDRKIDRDIAKVKAFFSRGKDEVVEASGKVRGTIHSIFEKK